MAELTLSAADIASAIKKNLEGFTPSLEARTVGRGPQSVTVLPIFLACLIALLTNSSSLKTEPVDWL